MAATVGGDVLGYGAARADVSSAKPHRCTARVTGLNSDVRSVTQWTQQTGLHWRWLDLFHTARSDEWEKKHQNRQRLKAESINELGKRRSLSRLSA